MPYIMSFYHGNKYEITRVSYGLREINDFDLIDLIGGSGSSFSAFHFNVDPDPDLVPGNCQIDARPSRSP
jgi:hypothetical protein